MVSDVSADSLDALTQFGQHLGMCFQVVDDVLDVTATEAELGKPTGQRRARRRVHAAVIYALAGVGRAARAARPQARMARRAAGASI